MSSSSSSSDLRSAPVGRAGPAHNVIRLEKFRTLQDCKQSSATVSTSQVVIASPRWWYTKQIGAASTRNCRYKLVCPPQPPIDTSEQTLDPVVSAGVTLIPWKQVDRACRRAALLDALRSQRTLTRGLDLATSDTSDETDSSDESLAGQDGMEVIDATGGNSDKCDSDDDDTSDDDDDKDDVADDEKDADNDKNEDTADDDEDNEDDGSGGKARGETRKKKEKRSIRSLLGRLGKNRKAPLFLCIDGSSVLLRLLREELSTPSTVKDHPVSVLEFSAPRLEGHEVIYIAQSVTGVKMSQRLPGITNTPCSLPAVDYAGATAQYIVEVKLTPASTFTWLLQPHILRESALEIGVLCERTPTSRIWKAVLHATSPNPLLHAALHFPASFASAIHALRLRPHAFSCGHVIHPRG